MDYLYILLPICGTILCLAASYILHIRAQRKLNGTKEKDYFHLAAKGVQKHIRHYGSSMTPDTYLGIGILAYAGTAICLMMLRQSVWVCLIGGSLGFFLPELILRLQSNRAKKQFEDRYARALQQFASSLRSGLTIQQAVADLCHCPFIHESIRVSFRQIDADLKVGISVREAFERAAEQLGSVDAKDTAIAISLQNEVGGNEAKVIETIARNISSRIMLRREVKSLFADANMTILMMDIVPFLILAALLIGSPQYVAPFFETPLMMGIFAAILIFTVIGSFVIRKTVKKGTEG